MGFCYVSIVYCLLFALLLFTSYLDFLWFKKIRKQLKNITTLSQTNMFKNDFDMRETRQIANRIALKFSIEVSRIRTKKMLANGQRVRNKVE